MLGLPKIQSNAETGEVTCFYFNFKCLKMSIEPVLRRLLLLAAFCSFVLSLFFVVIETAKSRKFPIALMHQQNSFIYSVDKSIN